VRDEGRTCKDHYPDGSKRSVNTGTVRGIQGRPGVVNGPEPTFSEEGWWGVGGCMEARGWTVGINPSNAWEPRTQSMGVLR
jgi:hypothetical protein